MSVVAVDARPRVVGWLAFNIMKSVGFGEVGKAR